ncbi:hypothetical protein B0J14DRAFT_221377 [Halenospora varia]|nr:hypothetical protein B0J14DRAFT_221377 [Halenospora varia]
MDKPPELSEQEKRIVLAELIKQTSIPLDRLLNFLNESNFRPTHQTWLDLIPPYGRNPQSCMDAYESLLRSGHPSPYASLPLPPSISNKRKSIPESMEHLMTAPSPKRRQSGHESIPSARALQPKPTSANGSPLPFTSIPGPPAPQPKKRGRPSKADVEQRQQEAIARGEVLPPPKTLTPKGPKQPGMEEQSGSGFAAIAPMAITGPSGDPSMGGQYQTSPAMGDIPGKKKRARATPRQPKVPKNPGESTFPAVNPQSILSQAPIEPAIASPSLPHAPAQPFQPKNPEPPVQATEAPIEPSPPAPQAPEKPQSGPHEELKTTEPQPPPTT